MALCACGMFVLSVFGWTRADRQEKRKHRRERYVFAGIHQSKGEGGVKNNMTNEKIDVNKTSTENG